MDSTVIADRYEVVKITEDRFVTKAIVKDNKAFGKLRTILSVNEDNLSNPNIVDWFNSQSELFTSISSDYVVDFIDRHAAGEIMESPTIVVEEPGLTLSDLIDRGAIQPAAALSIVTKVLMGVNELHERDYLHLDIRPETIGVNKSATEVKLLSLGNCIKLGGDTMSLTPNNKYGAAECYSPDDQLERRTDIYSIGFMLYEMLCGSKAFSKQFTSISSSQSELDRNTNWTNWHVSEKKLLPIDSIVEGLDEKLVACIHKMIDKDISIRYSSTSTVLNELNAILGNTTTAGLTGSFAASNTNTKKKWGWLKITGIAVAALLSIGLVALMLLNKASSGGDEITIEQRNAMIETAKAQRSAITALGWSDREEIVNADATYDLAIKAYEEDDLDTMYSHIEESMAVYGPYIDANAPDAMTQISNQLQVQVDQAQTLGVDDASEALEHTLEFDGLADLESKYLGISANVDELASDIRNNSRTVTIGSTQDQINEALTSCEQFSDSCELAWYEDELERTVTLTPFALDKKEVTVSEFQEYVDSSDVTTLAEERSMSSRVVIPYSEYAVVQVADLNWANAYEADAENLPVVHVSQADASAYCESLSKRLPSEAEWELVAAGYDRKQYPWGAVWDESMLYWGETAEPDLIRPVGSFPATESGHYDLAGGVSEWTSTRDGSGDNAFIKGASRFDSNAANIRVAVRRLEPIDYSGEDVGFRCAQDLNEWAESN